MIDFKTWQQSECLKLKITTELHNLLLKKSIELAIQTDDFKPYDETVIAFKLGQRISECFLKN